MCELAPIGQVTERVIASREGEFIEIGIVDGKMMPRFDQARGRYYLTDLGSGTRVTFELEYQLAGGVAANLVDALVMKRFFKKAASDTLAGLKLHAETGEHVTAKSLKHAVRDGSIGGLQLDTAR